MSKSNQFTRKIKCLGNCVGKNEVFLHPITLTLQKNKIDDPVCPTQLYYKNDKLYYSDKVKSTHLDTKDIQKFMALPYLNLNIDQILSIYKIDTIDSLIKWINIKIIEKKPYKYVNRIINIWIKSNYNDLHNNNLILSSVYEIINNKYWSNIMIDNLNEYIDKWFKTTKYDDFYFNLGDDLYNFIIKKI